MSSPIVLPCMTTGEWYANKKPAYRSGFHYDENTFPAGKHRPGDYGDEDSNQVCDIYARHTGYFALDLDLYDDAKMAGYETSALRAYIRARKAKPYLTRGRDGSARFLVYAGESSWFPSAGRCTWGEIRSAGIGPSPGTRHFNGHDFYVLYPGPDLLPFPPEAGYTGPLMTNVLRLDDALQDALEEDGARREKKRTGFVVDVDFREDDDGEQECPLARAWYRKTDLAGQSGPTSERVFRAVAFLKRQTAEGHFTRAIVDDARDDLTDDELPHGGGSAWEDMWARTEVNPSPEPTDCGCLDDEDEEHDEYGEDDE